MNKKTNVNFLFSSTCQSVRFALELISYSETYRSGHNGAHSKCVSPPGHVGSNPTVSALKRTYRLAGPFLLPELFPEFLWDTLCLIYQNRAFAHFVSCKHTSIRCSLNPSGGRKHEGPKHTEIHSPLR